MHGIHITSYLRRRLDTITDRLIVGWLPAPRDSRIPAVGGVGLVRVPLFFARYREPVDSACAAARSSARAPPRMPAIE